MFWQLSSRACCVRFLRLEKSLPRPFSNANRNLIYQFATIRPGWPTSGFSFKAIGENGVVRQDLRHKNAELIGDEHIAADIDGDAGGTVEPAGERTDRRVVAGGQDLQHCLVDLSRDEHIAAGIDGDAARVAEPAAERVDRRIAAGGQDLLHRVVAEIAD